MQTGTNRCAWVRMGADGCVGVQGAREAQKQGKRGALRVMQGRIWALCPGKFPGHNVLGDLPKLTKNE